MPRCAGQVILGTGSVSRWPGQLPRHPTSTKKISFAHHQHSWNGNRGTFDLYKFLFLSRILNASTRSQLSLPNRFRTLSVPDEFSPPTLVPLTGLLRRRYSTTTLRHTSGLIQDTHQCCVCSWQRPPGADGTRVTSDREVQAT